MDDVREPALRNGWTMFGCKGCEVADQPLHLMFPALGPRGLLCCCAGFYQTGLRRSGNRNGPWPLREPRFFCPERNISRHTSALTWWLDAALYGHSRKPEDQAEAYTSIMGTYCGDLEPCSGAAAATHPPDAEPATAGGWRSRSQVERRRRRLRSSRYGVDLGTSPSNRYPFRKAGVLARSPKGRAGGNRS
ncbi:MAG: hypothetical protein JWQ56_1175 [Pseudarthrobacter sp.]|nr:hypothetical protein [Pseudarthrobacter sp.]